MYELSKTIWKGTLSMFKTKFAASVAAASVAILSPVVAHAEPASVNPGDQIEIQFSNHKVSLCTLTSVVKDKKGDLYGVTAAHCVRKRDDGSSVEKISSRNVPISDDTFMKNYYGPNSYHHNPDGKVFSDMAIFKLEPGVTTSGVIDENTPVGNAQPLGDVHKGDAVCKYGRSTQKTCGKVTKIDYQRGSVEASVFAIGGDSGSPIYSVDDNGVAHVIASLSGGYVGNDDLNFGDEVSGDFAQWGVEVVGQDNIPQPSPAPDPSHSPLPDIPSTPLKPAVPGLSSGSSLLSSW